MQHHSRTRKATDHQPPPSTEGTHHQAQMGEGKRMNQHQIKAQAQLLSERLGVEVQAVAAVLTEYWKDQIAYVWGIGDVQSLRESLTDEEAIAVLHHVDKTHDANIGINWDSIEASIQALYG